VKRVVCGLAFGVAVAVGCNKPEQTGMVIAAGTLLDSADQVAFGSRTLITDAGLLRAEIFADTTMFLDQNARIVMRVVHGDFFNAQGGKDATMTANRAQYDTRNEQLQAWGNVIVTAVDGRVLKSPMLKFDSRLNQISSDSAFTMLEPDGKEVRGVGFDADPNLNVVNVRRLDRGRGGSVNLSRP
jgi:LPS export ABC transporter protein LptC